MSATADWLETAAFGASYPAVVLVTVGWFLLIYTVIAGGAYALAVGQLPDTTQSADGRVQRMRPGQVRDELVLSLVSILVFAAQAVGLVWALREGWLDASWERPAWHLVWELPVLYLWNELHFFAVHRLMHWPPLYRTVHVRHHRSVITTPFSAYCFHPVESFLLGSVMPLALVLHPFSPLALVGLTIMSLVLDVIGHLPHECVQSRLSCVVAQAKYHNEHHRRGRTNFGFSLSFAERRLSNIFRATSTSNRLKCVRFFHFD